MAPEVAVVNEIDRVRRTAPNHPRHRDVLARDNGEAVIFGDWEVVEI